MIRRAFWLVLGAVLGVTGYRRASRLARAMRPVRRPSAGLAAGFLADVREGRAEYLDRHLVHRGPTLEVQQMRDQLPRAGSRNGTHTPIDYAKDGR